METTAATQQKTLELLLWMVGMTGTFLAVLPLNNANQDGIIDEAYVPYFLLASMILIAFSLFLRIKRSMKSKNFSIYNHLFQILRTAGGIALAIYGLVQNS